MDDRHVSHDVYFTMDAYLSSFQKFESYRIAGDRGISSYQSRLIRNRWLNNNKQYTVLWCVRYSIVRTVCPCKFVFTNLCMTILSWTSWRWTPNSPYQYILIYSPNTLFESEFLNAQMHFPLSLSNDGYNSNWMSKHENYNNKNNSWCDWCMLSFFVFLIVSTLELINKKILNR